MGGNDTGTNLHLPVGQGRAVFYHQYFFAPNYGGIVNIQGGGTVDNDRIRRLAGDVAADDLNPRGIGAVHLIDDDDIRHPQRYIARIVSQFMARTMGIDDGDMQVGFVKRKIVVAAVPQNDITAIGIFFRRPDDGFVIHTGINYVATDHVGFVFLHFFHRAVMFFQIGQFGKPLDFLGRDITIGHGMPDGDYF